MLDTKDVYYLSYQLVPADALASPVSLASLSLSDHDEHDGDADDGSGSGDESGGDNDDDATMAASVSSVRASALASETSAFLAAHGSSAATAPISSVSSAAASAPTIAESALSSSAAATAADAVADQTRPLAQPLVSTAIPAVDGTGQAATSDAGAVLVRRRGGSGIAPPPLPPVSSAFAIASRPIEGVPSAAPVALTEPAPSPAPLHLLKRAHRSSIAAPPEDASSVPTPQYTPLKIETGNVDQGDPKRRRSSSADESKSVDESKPVLPDAAMPDAGSSDRPHLGAGSAHGSSFAAPMTVATAAADGHAGSALDAMLVSAPASAASAVSFAATNADAEHLAVAAAPADTAAAAVSAAAGGASAIATAGGAVSGARVRRYNTFAAPPQTPPE